eukprot:CAMPEP_0195070706 /NCGR_PEP_ID=MMETSP0448-20130528/14697_1 /TAXON_ID=66468 /ORGANISM="Heterocapsa triquestra, Strain CCMP 448" /LENGTH=117 /DNA_ID=CAMNT_0040102447 /DNA_START=349 /DNA_END=698 /DNA_ORIENTATION=+
MSWDSSGTSLKETLLNVFDDAEDVASKSPRALTNLIDDVEDVASESPHALVNLFDDVEDVASELGDSGSRSHMFSSTSPGASWSPIRATAGEHLRHGTIAVGTALDRQPRDAKHSFR